MKPDTLNSTDIFTNLLVKYNNSFWTDLLPICKNLPLPLYYNLIYHPFTILMDTGIIQTYQYNEDGEYKLYIHLKKPSNYLITNGINVRKYLDKNFALVYTYDNSLVYSANFNTVDHGKDPYKIAIAHYTDYCFQTISLESQFILKHDLIHNVIKNTPYACALLKAELGHSLCQDILPITSDENETFTSLKTILT